MRPLLVSDAEVLEVALDAFGTSGFDGASLREICQQLGVSHTYIHKRFGAKQDVWYLAVQRGFDRLIADTTEALSAARGNDIEMFEAIVRTFVRLSIKHPGALGVIRSESAAPSPRLTYLVEHFLSPAHRALGAVVERLIDAGRMRPVSTATIEVMLVNGVGSLIGLRPAASRFELSSDDLEKQALLAAESFVAGLFLPPHVVAFGR